MIVPPLIAQSVIDILERTDGDPEAAVDYIRSKKEKTAIRDAMALLNETRTLGRYEHSSFPPLPDVLRRKGKDMPDDVWEGRHAWTNPLIEPGTSITRLDTNAAYLSAMTTHLPIGQLEYEDGDVFDRKRSGVYLITPPEWTRTDLPNPLGNREEAGRLWVGRPTLQLLLDCATDKHGSLCGVTVIHGSWTSGSTESVLQKFRKALADTRAHAIEHGDQVLLEYVKAMYAKFISTLGESTANPEIRRPDWMHLIRAQAFANLWRKAKKAHDAGIEVYKVNGTDELHLGGDAWRTLWKEGRGLSEMKVKAIGEDGGVYQVPARRRR